MLNECKRTAVRREIRFLKNRMKKSRCTQALLAEGEVESNNFN